MTALRLALAQSRVGTDVRANGRTMRSLMKRAGAAGADLVHFTEGTLSGYGRKHLRPFETWSDEDWRVLASETDRIRELADVLNLWVVFGSVEPLPRSRHPHNALFVIGPDGEVHSRYDKRYCSHNELESWYTPGYEPCVFEVHGVRFGCLICLDGRFPEVWDEYRRLGIHCALFSAFTGGRQSEDDAEADAIFGLTARAQAANHLYWVSLVAPANRVQGTRTQFINPAGQREAACARHRNAIAVGTLDLGPAGVWEATRRARDWRALAREGDIYRAKAGG